MKIGCCIPVEFSPMAADMGFDFVELRVPELFPEGSEEEFENTRQAIEKVKIPALSYNFFLPASLKVVGQEVDTDRFKSYVEVAVRRAASLGGKFIVFGSGRSRWIPTGFPRETALRQFHEAARIAGDIAQRQGMQIALEPLNHTEANLMHTVKEGVENMKAIDHPAVGVLADLYHMCLENEPLHHLFLAGDRLLHVHVCDAGRATPGTRTYDLWGFHTYLNAMGFNGAVSMECRFTNFTSEGPIALRVMQDVIQERGEVTFSV